MKRPNLLQPRFLATFAISLFILLCWFALGGGDASRESRVSEPSAHESQVPVSQISGPAEVTPAPSAEEPTAVSTNVEEKARSTSKPIRILPSNFLEEAVQGDTVRFTLPDNTTIAADIRYIERDDGGVLVVDGIFEKPEPGRLLIQRQTAPGVAGPFVGHVQFDDGDKAWKIEPTEDRAAAQFVERSIHAVACRGLALPPENYQVAGDAQDAPQYAPQGHPTDIPTPPYQPVTPLESLPGATGVIYLDFDGEEGPFPGWGDVHFDVEPANATNAQIFEVWKRVSEDYQGFNLNITTDRKVYDAAPAGRRQHVIITPTRDFLLPRQPGGTANTGSFNWTTPRVCWAFSQTGKIAAEVITHEVGHTLQLAHHGTDDGSTRSAYYLGHGSGDVSWAPIMGVGYYYNLSQWSKGEYLHANRSSQDDLEIIAFDNNDVGYRDDDSGETLASAKYLEIFSDNSVDNEGIIERTGDVDAYRFQTTGGSINLDIDPVAAGPNLDIHAEIVHADTLALVIEDNPLNGIDANLATTLSGGEYLLRVRGTGRGDPLSDGYTNYGSLGTYIISGTVQNGLQPERFSVAENSANGTSVGTVTPGNDHGGASLSFSIASENTDSAFAIDASTGTLSVADASVLDYEVLSTRWDDPAVITPFVSISNPDDPSLNETLRVVVEILDVNEAPTIEASSFTMPERTAPGTLLTTVTGNDPDRYQLVSFSISSGNDDGLFQIDSESGLLTIAQSTDLGATLTRQLTVAATDTGVDSPLMTTTTINATVVDHSATDAPGQVKRTVFENISGSTIESLTSAPSYPDDPDQVITLTSFDGYVLGENHGSTIRSYLVAPATGDYQFRIAAADSGTLLFAANGDPASATEIASTSSSTYRYEWDRDASQISSAISLQQGQVCYIEARQKVALGRDRVADDGVGPKNDHVAVAWTGPQISEPEVIPGRFLVPFYENYSPSIPGLTLSIRENAILGQIVGFVMPEDADPDETFSDFEILGGSGQAYFAIDAATGRVTVAAPLDVQVSPLTLDLRVSDNGTPALSAEGSITVEITPGDSIGVSGIIQEIWSGINGRSISDLTSQPGYPLSPSSTRSLTNGFDTDTNFANNYGSRIRALVTPPTTGEYTFYITTDDNGKLLMSSDSNAAGATTIAEVTDWANPGQWDKFPSQTSEPRQLTAGESYYIETLHKEDGRGDHVQVAWTGPGISTPTIIPASALEPFNINAAPEFTSASYNFTLNASIPLGSEIGTVSAIDPEGNSVAYLITEGNEGGHFAIDAAGRITLVSNESLFNGIAELTVMAQDSGIDGPYPLSSATASVSIDVVGYPISETDYADWAEQWPGIDLGGPQDDFSGDGMTNEEKRIWGLDPTDASSIQPFVQLPDPESLSFTYTRRLPATTGYTFTIWTSTDLVSWTPDHDAVQTSSGYDANDVETVTVTLSSETSPERIFVKVVAE